MSEMPPPMPTRMAAATPTPPDPQGPAPSSPAQAPLSHRQILIIFSGLMLGMFLAALDNTIVNTALNSIVGDLGGQSQLTWVVTSYLLTSTITILLWGKLSDIHGRKVMFQVSIALFLVASMLVGLSPNMMFLVAARGLQGIGAGGIMSLAFAIIGDILSPRERGKYMGLMGSVFLIAMVIGPALGGWIVQTWDFGGISPWRWIFYINLPVGIPALFITGIVLRVPFHKRRERVDYAGFGLLAAGTSAIILALTWVGQPAAWSDAYNLRWAPGIGEATFGPAAPTGMDAFLSSWLIAILLSAGLLLTLAFVLWERRTPHPLLPLRLFNSRTYTLGSIVSLLVGAAMFGGFVFLPTYLQMSTGAEPMMSGFLMLPMMAGMFPFMTGSGILVSRTGRYKLWPMVGLPVGAAGLLLLSTISATSGFWHVSGGMFLLGAGIGMTMQVVVVAVQNVLEMRDLGIGTSANTFMRQMGGVFGVGIFGAYLAGRIVQLGKDVAPIAAQNGVDPASIGASLKVTPALVQSYPPALRDAITGGFADIIGHIFLFAAPIMVVAWLVMIFVKEIPLSTMRSVGGGAAATPAGTATAAARVAERNGAAVAATNGHTVGAAPSVMPVIAATKAIQMAVAPATPIALHLDELHRRVDAIAEPRSLRLERLDAMVHEKAWPSPDKRVRQPRLGKSAARGRPPGGP